MSLLQGKTDITVGTDNQECPEKQQPMIVKTMYITTTFASNQGAKVFSRAQEYLQHIISYQYFRRRNSILCYYQ